MVNVLVTRTNALSRARSFKINSGMRKFFVLDSVDYKGHGSAFQFY